MRVRVLNFLGLAIATGFLAICACAHPATGIVLDRVGNLYFSDLETIWKIDTNGNLSVFRPGVSGRHVHELTMDGEDNLFGADYSYVAPKFISAIWKMTRDGKFEYLLEPTDTPPRGSSIWRDRDGNSYFVEQNNHTHVQTLLVRRSREGRVTTLAGSGYGYADGKSTNAKFSSIGNIAFGPDGDLYVTDGDKVRKVNMAGDVSTLASKLDTRTVADQQPVFGNEHSNLTGLSVDNQGNVYAADPENRRLFRIDRNGNAQVVLRTDPPYFPNGVIAAPSGDVYVLEVGFKDPQTWVGPRVRRIGVDGKQTILATVGEKNSRAVVSNSSPTIATFSKTMFPIPLRYIAIVLGVFVLGSSGLIWKRRRREHL